MDTFGLMQSLPIIVSLILTVLSHEAPKIDPQDGSEETRGDPPGRQVWTNLTFAIHCSVQPVSAYLSSLMQNAGMITGMVQKANPFKSAQPKVCDDDNDDHTVCDRHLQRGEEPNGVGCVCVSL